SAREHDPENACPALDAELVPIFGKDHAPRIQCRRQETLACRCQYCSICCALVTDSRLKSSHAWVSACAETRGPERACNSTRAVGHLKRMALQRISTGSERSPLINFSTRSAGKPVSNDSAPTTRSNCRAAANCASSFSLTLPSGYSSSSVLITPA